MPNHIVVVEKRSDFRWDDANVHVMTAQEFILDGPPSAGAQYKVTNLCRSYSYMSLGYYVSLLAEARGDRVTPSVASIIDLQNKSIVAPRLAGLRNAIVSLDRLPTVVNAVSMPVFFGEIGDPQLADLGRRAFELFRFPLLDLDLERSSSEGGWRLAAVRSLDARDVEPEQDANFIAALSRYTRRPWRKNATRTVPHMDLAILYDPDDALAPSNASTVKAFAELGADMGISVDLIGKNDIAKLPQYDALFIRETTAVAHHTFRFARRATEEGMPVLDDPGSILRCTNKAFLSELLTGNGVATPKTLFVTRKSLARLEGRLSYPVVLKVPDGAFSLAVKKAENWSEFEHLAILMLRQSDLILVQEFLYTPFDWRVGTLNGEVIFAAKYFMCDNHWQIIDHAGARPREGETAAIRLQDVPQAVTDAAIAASRLIGGGLYGVDIKEHETGPYVIEVNDNPNINLSDEGQIDGERILRAILTHFQTLVEERHASRKPKIVSKPPRNVALLNRSASG